MKSMQDSVQVAVANSSAIALNLTENNLMNKVNDYVEDKK